MSLQSVAPAPCGPGTLLLLPLLASLGWADPSTPGPESALGAPVGGLVWLRCPCPGPAGGLDLTCWRRDTGAVLHRRAGGADRPASQDPRYRGRTALSEPALAAGVCALQLSALGPDDAGRYLCAAAGPAGRTRCSFLLRVSEPTSGPQDRTTPPPAARRPPQGGGGWPYWVLGCLLALGVSAALASLARRCLRGTGTGPTGTGLTRLQALLRSAWSGPGTADQDRRPAGLACLPHGQSF